MKFIGDDRQDSHLSTHPCDFSDRHRGVQHQFVSFVRLHHVEEVLSVMDVGLHVAVRDAFPVVKYTPHSQLVALHQDFYLVQHCAALVVGDDVGDKVAA